jgi:Ca-activated chloride channel family protein
MKTKINISPAMNNWKKLLPFFILIGIAGCMMLMSTCKKDSDNSNSGQAYSNMNDDSTTAIDVSIPRIEIGSGRATKITIFLSVTDQNGNPFKEFNQYNFNIKQVCDGQTDTTVIASITFTKADVEGYKIASSMVMDYSGSMGGAAKKNMEKAAKQFVYLKEDQDYCEIIKFDDIYQVIQPFTNDVNILLTAIDQGYGGGATAFYDATFAGTTDAADFLTSHSGMLPSVLAFTDGQDNESQLADLPFCITMANKDQVPVYAIGYRNSVDSVSLRSLAEQTGGRYYFTPNSEDLSRLYSLISGQLKNLYMLTWDYDNPTCQKVWVYVVATYTCATGTYTAKTEKYFFPMKK